MKIRLNEHHRGTAFTIAEIMIAMATTLMVVAGTLGAYIYAIRMRQFTESKLTASDEARRAISLMSAEFRSAFLIKVGNGSLNSFTEVGLNAPQSGSAVQIYTGTNSSQFIRYYWDASDGRLKRTTNGSTAVYVVANSISNETVFRAEDFRGVVLSNNFNNRIISMSLSFYKKGAKRTEPLRLLPITNQIHAPNDSVA